ncbi:hypothetical protein KOAAANKH_02530 [Brevundimonas sp. NIBR10]|uniref:hypothetical protein n=1 Tax=Brevundimonas sp. NIBR10 TaxID=3015997 RepID=UPI0022F16D6E|nr:hypothetical protein [Brevundimonas sp. NIBR10]WGM47648.1 hypothetical protein KOAAANKH_02530 [Brevundimonas sp. NIBR10]
MALPLLAIAAGAAALQGIATIGSGIMSAKANASQKLGAEIEQKMALLRGKQIAERSRQDLSTALGNIQVIQSARGVSNDSQTSRLIERRTMQDAYRDEGVAVLGELNRAQNAGMAAKGYGTAAKWAIPLSVLNSAGSFANAASYGSMAGKK